MKVKSGLKVKVTPEEFFDLNALAIELHTTPERILEKFVADLTGSLRSNGSDERALASNWVSRNYWPGPSLTDEQRETCDRLRSRAMAARSEARKLLSKAA